MAVNDAYATATEYRTAVEHSDTTDDAQILTDLTDASRMLDALLGRADGAFNQSASETRRFHGNGKAVLDLRADGLQHGLVSVGTDGIAVDTDADETAEYSFDPAGETWCVLLPRNADTSNFAHAYDAIELLDVTGNTSLKTWAEGRWNVAVTGVWGYSSVPGLVQQLAIKFARDLREAHQAGPRGEIYMLDNGVTVRGDTWRLWKRIEGQYSRRRRFA